MSLMENLKMKQEKAIDNKVVEFAEEMESIIIQSAEKGYGSFRYTINNENPDKHLMRSQKFAEKLEMLMDGVKVRYEVQKKKYVLLASTYNEYSLLFDWTD
ncbi:hypothetical protein [Peribacillus muralis]|uniref:hypothetical protein n=1 Tax=Peribacillus muralis TaxID=264697 RepID=UPI003D00A5EA